MATNTPEIKTKFSLEGLAASAASLRAFAASAKSAIDPVVEASAKANAAISKVGVDLAAATGIVSHASNVAAAKLALSLGAITAAESRLIIANSRSMAVSKAKESASERVAKADERVAEAAKESAAAVAQATAKAREAARQAAITAAARRAEAAAALKASLAPVANAGSALATKASNRAAAASAATSRIAAPLVIPVRNAAKAGQQAASDFAKGFAQSISTAGSRLTRPITAAFSSVSNSSASAGRASAERFNAALEKALAPARKAFDRVTVSASTAGRAMAVWTAPAVKATAAVAKTTTDVAKALGMVAGAAGATVTAMAPLATVLKPAAAAAWQLAVAKAMATATRGAYAATRALEPIVSLYNKIALTSGAATDRTAAAFKTMGATAASSLRGATKAALSLSAAMATVSGRALSAGKATAGMGVELAKRAAAYGAAGTAAGGAAIAASISSTSKLVTEQERLSRAAGTSAEAMAGLTSAAAAYGVEADEVMGGLSSLSDKIAEAARGEGAAEVFQKIGVSVTNANGKLRDSSDVLQDLMDATKRLNATERANVFNDLLGGDAEKMAEFLSKSGRGDVKDAQREAVDLGAVASKEQVALFREWSTVVQSLKQAMRGLGLAISERILPSLIEGVKWIVEFVRVNREVIGDAVLRMWNKFWYTVSRVAQAFWNLTRNFYLFEVVRSIVASLIRSFQNLWQAATGGSGSFARDLIIIALQITALIERVTRFAAVNASSMTAVGSAWNAFATVVKDVGNLLLGQNSLIKTSWIAKLPETLATAKQAVTDFWNALTFDDSAVSKQGAWMVTLRDQVIQVAVTIAATIAGIGKTVFDLAAQGASAAWQAISGFATEVATTFRDAKTVVEDFFRILSDGAGAKTNSDFMTRNKDSVVAFRDTIIEVGTYLGKFWETLKGVMSTLGGIFNPLLSLFNTDFASLAMVVGVLKFTGLLSTIPALVGGVVSAFAGLAGAPVAALTVLGASLSTVVTVLGLAIAAGAALGAKLGEIAGNKLGNALYGQQQQDIVNQIRDRAAADHDRRAAMRASMSAPAPVSQSASDYYTPDPSNPGRTKDGGIDVWSGNNRTVDLNFNIGGNSYNGRFSPSQADGLTRELAAFSRRGGN